MLIKDPLINIREYLKELYRTYGLDICDYSSKTDCNGYDFFVVSKESFCELHQKLSDCFTNRNIYSIRITNNIEDVSDELFTQKNIDDYLELNRLPISKTIVGNNTLTNLKELWDYIVVCEIGVIN